MRPRAALFLCALALTACAHVPAVYRMRPEEVAQLRASLGTVGVSVSQYPPALRFATPAAGWWGGFVRGFSSGAAAPVLVGFLAPVPGGTLLGCLVAPITGTYSGLRGAARSPSRATVDAAKRGIRAALARLARINLRTTTLAPFVRYAAHRTGRSFVPLPGIGPRAPDETVDYSCAGLRGVDTVLELRAEYGGLWGKFDVNPPSAVYVEVHVRLIRVRDDHVLLHDTIMCIGEERMYEDWGRDDGRLVHEAMLALLPRLHEKLVDDLFLVYPLGRR